MPKPDSQLSPSVRSFVKAATVLAAGAVAPQLSTSVSAAAEKKLSKAAVKYQNTSNNGKDCDDCLQFIPGKIESAPGTCKVVEGEINPHGYCIAWVAKG